MGLSEIEDLYKLNGDDKIWLIGISGTDMDDVMIHKFRGTLEEVKQHLVSLVRRDRFRHNDIWEHGTLITEDIRVIENTNRLYAYGSYSSFHNDYTAMLEEECECINQ
jgi:hypothetical protein